MNLKFRNEDDRNVNRIPTGFHKHVDVLDDRLSFFGEYRSTCISHKQSRSSLGDIDVISCIKNAFATDQFVRVKTAFDLLVQNEKKKIFDSSALLNRKEILTDKEGNSPLCWASSFGNINLVTILLKDYGFPINHQNYEGNTPLTIAVLGGFCPIVKLLLEEGANPNIPNLKRESPLHLASCLGYNDICEDLIRHGAWIEAEDEFGDTALHWAVREEKVEIVEILLRYGANPDHPNEDRESPKDIANLDGNNKELVDLLDSIAGFDVDNNLIDSLSICNGPQSPPNSPSFTG